MGLRPSCRRLEQRRGRGWEAALPADRDKHLSWGGNKLKCAGRGSWGGRGRPRNSEGQAPGPGASSVSRAALILIRA